MTTPNETGLGTLLLIEERNCDFQVGDVVRLLNDHPDDELKAGDAGYVWCVCSIWHPYYEADFYRSNGTSTTLVFSAEEVELTSDPLSVHIPDEVHKFWQREAERNAEAKC